MTTDRTAAPPRSTALAERPAAARTPAPPADAFSALLGAAAPKSDAPVRQHERRDDAPRHDDGPRPLPRDEAPRTEHERPAKPQAEAPAPDAEAPVEATVPVQPPFTLQLASPLPAPVPTAPVATPAPTEAAPVLPSLIPASVAAATATPVTPAELAGAVAASAVTATEEPAPLPGGLVAASVQAEPQADVPENLVKPQLPGAVPASAAQAAPTVETQTQTGGESQPDGDGRPAQPAPAVPAPATPAAAATPQPSTEPAAAEPAAPQPATPQAPAAATAGPAAQLHQRIERAVPLSRALPTTGVLIQVASERGISHARLNLKPAELGGIEVKLHSTPAGIHAQLIADSPEAARMLARAGDDLRQQLEDRNVALLSLDVSTSGEQRGEQATFSETFGDGDRYRPGVPEQTVLMETPAAADTVLVLPDGVHVDVLA